MTFLNVDGTAVVYDDHEKSVINPWALAVAAELLVELLEVAAPGVYSRAVAGSEDDTAAMVGECLLNEILRKLAGIQKLLTGYGQDRQAEVFRQRLNCFAVAPQGRAVYGGNAQWRQGLHQGESALPAGCAQRAFRGRINLFGVPPPVQLMMTGTISARNIIRLV